MRRTRSGTSSSACCLFVVADAGFSAYIAASRRSDRSLEARVESARRASEIHKRRTGRSLRVTEQDVINEEMYEEEDDDLPTQYKRLTAHLQTGSADFNRRLAAYLTNHVAMRSALDQAITNSYAQQYPNAPQYAHNQQNMFPSPMVAQTMMQQPQSQPQPPIPQQPAQRSPHAYRSSPYPAPGTPGYRQHSHNRPASIASPHEIPGYTRNYANSSPIEATNPLEARRMSMPASSVSPASCTSQPPPPKPSQPGQAPMQRQTSRDTKPTANTPQPMQPPQPLQQQPARQLNPMQFQDFTPLTTTLPMESQLLLGSSFNPNDPLTSMFMAGSENLAQPYYNFGPRQSMLKERNFHPSYDGMSATLAPSALDMSPGHTGYMTPSSATSVDSVNTPAFNWSFDSHLGEIKTASMTRSNSALGSGTITPGVDGGWESFIDDNSWVDNPV